MFNIFNALNWMINGKAPNMNTLTANDYYDRLKLIALSLFEWEGLPDSCNAKHLETTLYMEGRALFFKDPESGFLNAKCIPSGTLNHYDEPVKFTAFSTVYNHEFDRDECVLIRNNYLERPTDQSVILFASRLTEAERTIDTNVKAQKTPVLIRCDDKDRLTMKNLYKDYEGNEPFILGGKALNLEGLKVLKTDAPFVADKLQNYKHEIWNEALTFFGVNNANSDKRERLITDEVNANNEVISVNAQAMLLTRLEACKLINKMYPELNVSVKMRSFEGQEQRNDEGKEGNE
jgi:hypothetical protein